ncbi:hypothetical protein FB45DRAFT_61067 [Roridomyces roridus]|uniref:Uncharacterized protein n=1 Tax=Roridomyces roridus TaxID=1738132 RepID=A0AAD7BQD1_9AGAR|nr:hypothetical protein FB45DRAFT_61067 [Roridomyces roridus]
MSTSSLTLTSVTTHGAQSGSSPSASAESSSGQSSQPDYTPYLSETTYPLPHIAHLSPIEIFQLNRLAEGVSSPTQKDHRRRASLAGRVGMRLNLRLPQSPPPFPRPLPPRVIEASPPDLTLIPIPIDAVFSTTPHPSRSQPRVTFGADDDMAVSCTPRRARKSSTTAAGSGTSRRASIELLRFPPWKGKGKLQTADAEHLAAMAAQALTRTDSRLSAASEIAFAQPNAVGAIGRYQKTGFRNRNHGVDDPEEDIDPLPRPHDENDSTRIYTPSNPSSKLARMLGEGASGPGRPSPNLRLDTRFLDAGTPRLQRAATRSQESLTGYPYLDSPHTHPDLGPLPTDTPPSTPIVFQYPPPSPVAGGVDDEDAVQHEAGDSDIGIARSDSDAPGLQRRGTATRTVRVRRERFSYVLRPMEPGPLSAPPPGHSKSKSRSKTKVFQAFVVPVDDAGEWTGEWNQVDMQEVIKKLRGLH